MEIYFPIAEMSMNVFWILLLGGSIGFISGIFGVGGGFLLTPLLIFSGVPPAVAVATQANQLIGASVSGVIAHWRRRNVDVQMGGCLVAGGLLGSYFGMRLFAKLDSHGQIDLVIGMCYVFLLGLIGLFMLQESLSKIYRQRRGLTPAVAARRSHTWLQRRLPLKVRFPKSKLYVSIFLPLLVGGMVGILASIMGIGGSFLIIPAMIYIIGMPVSLVAGTSLFQVIFIAAMVTWLQAIQHQSVDFLLALFLLAGSVIGAQFGGRYSHKLKGETARIILAALALAVSLRMLYTLVATPADPYSMEIVTP